MYFFSFSNTLISFHLRLLVVSTKKKIEQNVRTCNQQHVQQPKIFTTVGESSESNDRTNEPGKMFGPSFLDFLPPKKQTDKQKKRVEPFSTFFHEIPLTLATGTSAQDWMAKR